MTVVSQPSRTLWSGQEHYDLYHLPEEEFLRRYPHRNSDAMRLRKKRDLQASKPPTNLYGLRGGFFDIETSGLKADFDTILCASVADDTGRVMTWRRDEMPQAHLLDDRAMCIAIRDYLDEHFDYIVTWYGKMFDVPFLNTRLTLEHGERPYEARMHIDALYLIPQGIAGRSLDNVARALRVQDEQVHKTKFDKRIWALANAGDKPSLDLIVDHNIKDVLLTARVFEKLRVGVKNVHR
jgi:uncharacterized protein YprB with RNaseH-like and TPR domain